MHSPIEDELKLKNAFAQRAGISKHITAVNHKTYNCKITNFIAQNNKLQVKNNNLQVKKTYR